MRGSQRTGDCWMNLSRSGTQTKSDSLLG
jgi:hypothetical protein